MALSHGRVVAVGETLYPHEQEGIDFAIQALPDTDPYHLWALIDLLDTRNTLGMSLSAVLNAPIVRTPGGVLRI